MRLCFEGTPFPVASEAKPKGRLHFLILEEQYLEQKEGNQFLRGPLDKKN